MVITLRQLRYFLALYEHRHFGKAARASAVSQPALSVQVKALETAMGGALIDRAARGVSPTALGHEVAAQARRVVHEAETLARIARAERGVEGAFSLGLIPTIAPYLLPLALDLIARRLPLLELRVREAKTDELITELNDGRLDAVVVAAPPRGRDLSGRLLFRDRFLLAVNCRDAVEKDLIDGAVRIEEVAKMRLLLLDEGHCLRDQALSVCNLAPRDATEQMGASSMATILRLVAGGYGATLSPEIAYDESCSLDQLQLIRLADPQPEREIWFLSHRRRDMAPPYAALSDILAEAGADRLLNARRATARASMR